MFQCDRIHMTSKRTVKTILYSLLPLGRHRIAHAFSISTLEALEEYCETYFYQDYFVSLISVISIS